MDAQNYLQQTINRITVLLVGGPEETTEALRYAAGLSKLCGAKVMLVCPVDLSGPLALWIPSPAGLGMAQSRVWEESGRQAEDTIEDAKKKLAQMGVAAQGKVLTIDGGIVARVRRATEGECDLVVVPEARTHGLLSFLHGDYAVDMVKNSECQVVVVHAFEKVGRPSREEP